MRFIFVGAFIVAIAVPAVAQERPFLFSIATAADAGDADTSDLFTELSRSADKQLWFVEAHLQ